MSGSNTQRSLALMRERGYFCQVVEHWNAHVERRQDLFGFVDVICLGENEVVGVQSCSAGNISTRVTKIREHENLAKVVRSGIRIIVQGWFKVNGRWTHRDVPVW